jgi:hypothetical protein
MSKIRAASFVGFLAVLVAIVGCEGDHAPVVKGAVQFDGQPIEKGSINFVPIDGNSNTAGGEIINGAYSVKVPQGVMKVTITWSKDSGRRKKLYGGPDSPERPLFDQVIPAKYSDMQQTELQYEVTPGENIKDWDLKK